MKLLKEQKNKLGIDRSVTLLKMNYSGIPVTWGFWRPVVFLPLEAEEWPDQRREIVLMHELAHVSSGRASSLIRCLATRPSGLTLYCLSQSSWGRWLGLTGY